MSRHCDRVTLIVPSCVRVGFGDLPAAFATRCTSCPDLPGFDGCQTAAQVEGDLARNERTRFITPITVQPTPAVNEKGRLGFEATLKLPRLDSNQ